MTMSSDEEFLPPSASEFKVQLLQALKSYRSPSEKLAKCEEAIYKSAEGLEESQLQIEVAREIVNQGNLYREAYGTLEQWERSLRLDQRQLAGSKIHKDMVERYAKQFYRRTNAWPWDESILISRQQPRTWSRAVIEGLSKLAKLENTVQVLSNLLQEAILVRITRESKKRGLSKVDRLVSADIYTAIESRKKGVALKGIDIKAISKKRKKDDEPAVTAASKKRSKEVKGPEPQGLAGLKGSKSRRPGGAKELKQDTVANEASEEESATGGISDKESAAEDGTGRSSGATEDPADETQARKDDADKPDREEDIDIQSAGGTEDAPAESIHEEDVLSQDIGHDRVDVSAGEISAADKSVGGTDAVGESYTSNDVDNTTDRSTGGGDAPGQREDNSLGFTASDDAIVDQMAETEDVVASGVAEEGSIAGSSEMNAAANTLATLRNPPAQESPQTPVPRAPRTGPQVTLPTPPLSDPQPLVRRRMSRAAHPGSPSRSAIVPVPSADGSTATAKAEAKKALDEINRRLKSCEEILAPPVTRIPEIAIGLRQIAAEMAGTHEKLKVLKEKAVAL